MSDNNLSDKIGKLKCPFCQKELRPLAIGWCCDCGLCADKELWQRLIRTRKALDRAKLILNNLLPNLDGYERLDVEKALEQIMALEQ